MKIRNIKPYLLYVSGIVVSAFVLPFSDKIGDWLHTYVKTASAEGTQRMFSLITALCFICIYKTYTARHPNNRKEPSLEKRKKSAKIRLMVLAPAPLLFITDVILMTLTDIIADFSSEYQVVYQIAVDLMLCGIAIFISSIYDLVKVSAEEKRLERLRSCVKKYPLEDIVNLIEKLPNVNVRITDGENDISIGSKAEIDSDSGEPFYKRYYVRQDEFVSLWDFREALAPFAPDGQLSVTNGKRLRECCNIRIADEPE